VTEFNPEKFDEKYEYYFEEIERAYSDAYQQLHGEYNSEILRAVDRHVLSESEPVYEGNGEFRVLLPDDTQERARSLPGDEEAFNTVLEAFTATIERELRVSSSSKTKHSVCDNIPGTNY
jgi:hypothetical protein